MKENYVKHNSNNKTMIKWMRMNEEWPMKTCITRREEINIKINKINKIVRPSSPINGNRKIRWKSERALIPPSSGWGLITKEFSELLGEGPQFWCYGSWHLCHNSKWAIHRILNQMNQIELNYIKFNELNEWTKWIDPNN